MRSIPLFSWGPQPGFPLTRVLCYPYPYIHRAYDWWLLASHKRSVESTHTSLSYNPTDNRIAYHLEVESRPSDGLVGV